MRVHGVPIAQRHRLGLGEAGMGGGGGLAQAQVHHDRGDVIHIKPLSGTFFI